MRLTVVGCSGSFPGPDAAASCYLVEADGYRLLLDLGSGALGPLQRHVDPADVDAVLLSHLHADHCLDLCPCYVARRYRPQGPAPGLVVHGPAGTAERLARAYAATTGEQGDLGDVLDVRPYPQGPFAVGPFTVTAVPVEHPVPAFGLRVAHGDRVLGYSGDTDSCDGLVEVARDVDLLLCEASFVEGRDTVRGLHLTGRRAGQAATAAGARRLLLTHVPPWTDPAAVLAEARAVYPGPLELAAPGAVHEV